MPECVQCDVTLTHHKNSGKLQCHYCGYNIPIPVMCHSCGSPNITTKGTGTQQIEKQLNDLFPNVAIARMDGIVQGVKMILIELLIRFHRKK